MANSKVYRLVFKRLTAQYQKGTLFDPSFKYLTYNFSQHL